MLVGTSRRKVWLRRLLVAGGLAVALGWLPYQVYGTSGLARLVKLARELEALRLEDAGVRAENQRLRAELELYEEDAEAAVERVARDELGLVKPGEVVMRIVVEGQDGPVAAQAAERAGGGR